MHRARKTTASQSDAGFWPGGWGGVALSFAKEFMELRQDKMHPMENLPMLARSYLSPLTHTAAFKSAASRRNTGFSEIVAAVLACSLLRLRVAVSCRDR